MEVKIYTDIACPFCYIGKKNIEKARAEFDAEESIDLNYLSYELDNQASKIPTGDIYQSLADKHKKPLDEIHDMVERIVEEGKKVGIDFNMDQVVPANTRNAHRLLKLAKENGKGSEVLDALYESYFTKGENVSDQEVLLNIGVKTGLEQGKVEELLNDPSIYLEEVIGDFNLAKVNQVKTLPYYIFDDKFAIAGAREIEHYLIAFKKTLQK